MKSSFWVAAITLGWAAVVNAQQPIHEAYFCRGASGNRDFFSLEAMTALNEAIRRKPNYGEAYFIRGNAYFSQKNYGRAIADYNQALKFLPPTYLNRALIYANRGNTYLASSNYRAAVRDLTVAIGLNRREPSWYLNRAVAQYRLGNRRAAANDFRAVAAIWRSGEQYLRALELAQAAQTGNSRRIESQWRGPSIDSLMRFETPGC